ncbi:type II-A CRISPR-associated protein Csn2 [Lachnospiraceae bacterium WCA-9-b2]|uniref:Type II-A CRISPR-associated protein Csn2 n=1 Tax=Sporofaciens musculi TaxID=2681861 RepID=A0A7X3MHA6_9FIRM|nr:type II-A CRISPR-associated protein Csn2 [Sporofaciens musculi]MXP76349.1 type II-A CRISPR-associated protein Csn2 [Sporofaciens musculi]
MKLVHKDFHFVFHFKENTRSLLVIEQPRIFLRLVSELTASDCEEESGFVLSENDEVLKKKDKLACIVNPLAISLNERKLLSKLGELLKKEILSTELLVEGNRIISDLESYVINIVQGMEWGLVYSDKMDIQSLLKLAEIRFDDMHESLVEKILDYMKVSCELLDVKCFVFVHLLSYLTEYEVEKFYEYVHYQKICVLLVENRQPDMVKKYSETIIIDKDSCEIHLDV